MRPTLAKGDWVLAHPAVDPRPGDVALLDASGWLEIHRLAARVSAGGPSWYVHLGDAGESCGLARREQILAVIPGLGRRPRPAVRAHAVGLGLRLGAVLDYLGLHPARSFFRYLGCAFRRVVDAVLPEPTLFIEHRHKSR
jgi:hypothetical protein